MDMTGEGETGRCQSCSVKKSMSACGLNELTPISPAMSAYPVGVPYIAQVAAAVILQLKKDTRSSDRPNGRDTFFSVKSICYGFSR
jgi:hypothetical protein